MIPVSDYPLDFLSDLPVHTHDGIREDKGYVLPRGFRTGLDVLMVGTRRLTDAEFRRTWTRWWVRSQYADVTLHGEPLVKVGVEPTRENVSLLERLKAYAPKPTGLTTTVEATGPAAVVMVREPTDWTIPCSRSEVAVEAKPIIRRAVNIETSRFARIADNHVIDQARSILEHDARAMSFKIASDLTIASREVLDGSAFRWYPAHYPVANPVRDRHTVVALTYDL